MSSHITKLLAIGALLFLALPFLSFINPVDKTLNNAEHMAQSFVPTQDFGSFAPSQDIGSQDPEANLPYLFAVYTVTWLAFFAYAFYLSRRQADLRRNIQALNNEIDQLRHRDEH